MGVKLKFLACSPCLFYMGLLPLPTALNSVIILSFYPANDSKADKVYFNRPLGFIYKTFPDRNVLLSLFLWEIKWVHASRMHVPFILTGDQAALHDLIKNGKIEISSLQGFKAEQLKQFCKECSIPYSGKSQVKFCLSFAGHQVS